MLSLISIAILSYLAGAIPTSIILSKLLRGIDIRDYGSGNAGGTNTIRILGWKIGTAVILVDVGKGVLATLLVSRLRIDSVPLTPDMLQIIAGSCAIIGHIWTLFAGFRGGKGVATGAGMLFSLYPVAGLICLVIFASLLLLVRIVSVSSMVTAISLPIVILIMNKFMNYSISNELLYFSIFAAALIVCTHRSNIKRLIKGEELPFKRINYDNRNLQSNFNPEDAQSDTKKSRSQDDSGLKKVSS
ncbi:MAG: glycerol-3-phosphate 1-O-acyltransferase PlsY [Candidatus Aminicenantes bacterium]|nr:glycerol-3-phosphate 1-O-acyltransferase PlsY [Candidatus Aminicenantes bacterium]NIM81967.1 glycerol-3-phosphate 1-O-acyltransferase PlsY [Candidatus Aminicenantes bacterium]NIN21355.1 glycerol-3-phosphate 1-O-acyltransferase PlsY [Candidatus Aminicenantes bacterium]NIN45176.1 glycerol-3-phosphate 1-O-acyltransferase PlsY [Candidatus Aminicenantes bacterium]NIN87993.1 glycerol-3-phosphate 1-O-acyltransferase PlsY [Candidatus Aminicenantes bacterium]